MKTLYLLVSLLMLFFCFQTAVNGLETDTIKTTAGDLKISFIGHGTLMLVFDGKVIHVDPWTRLADYAGMPRADLILITHGHRDHLDAKAVETLRTEKTAVILPEVCADSIEGGLIIRNGDAETVKGLKIEAVPAYNIVHMRSAGVPFHPKGEGNGYVITFGDKRVFVAGDTENVSEIKELKDIDVAFLPMNLPYTMTPEMVADAAKAINPEILYPYHYGNTDTSRLLDLMKNSKDIQVRIRMMK